MADGSNRPGRFVSVAILLVVFSIACSKSETPKPAQQVPFTAVYRGVMARANNETAALTLTVRGTRPGATSPVRAMPSAPEAVTVIDSVTARIAIVGGSTVATIQGTYDTGTNLLALSGSNFVMGGGLVNGRYQGTFLHNGISGIFVALVPAGASPAAYGGAWSGSGGTDQGSVAFVIDGVALVGVVFSNDGATNAQAGGSIDAGTGDVLCTFTGYTLTGTRTGGTIAGNFTSTLGGGRTGTWSVSAQAF